MSPVPEGSPRPVKGLSWSGMTHPGKMRPNNEDAFLALNFDAREVRHLGKIGAGSLGQSDYVFAVSDGMGGGHSGEFASRIATRKITDLLPRSFSFASGHFDVGFGDVLTELFSRIHGELIQMGQTYGECEGMGTTLSLGWFAPGRFCFGHIGDSRIYYLPHDGKMIQLTHDHTRAGVLRRRGEINERQERTHPRRGILTQVLGAGHQFLDPHLGALPYEPGDRFLFCTDGVNDGLWDHALEDLLRLPVSPDSPISPAQRIVETAVLESGRDNTTALVVMIE
ncbi:MAG: protein phosphatase 2C domain-containing protein [Verrucomicrobiae bacterium]|nr:protein phosphatase 2C domain-containing protein [Verrucomicrobiae bacterium]